MKINLKNLKFCRGMEDVSFPDKDEAIETYWDGMLYYSKEDKAFFFMEKTGEFIYIQHHTKCMYELTEEEKDDMMMERLDELGIFIDEDYFMTAHFKSHSEFIKT